MAMSGEQRGDVSEERVTKVLDLSQYSLEIARDRITFRDCLRHVFDKSLPSWLEEGVRV